MEQVKTWSGLTEATSWPEISPDTSLCFPTEGETYELPNREKQLLKTQLLKFALKKQQCFLQTLILCVLV